jgi:hypothetical protein
MSVKAGIYAFFQTTEKSNSANHLKNQAKNKPPGTFQFYELSPVFGRSDFEIFFTNNKLVFKKPPDAPRGAFLTPSLGL